MEVKKAWVVVKHVAMYGGNGDPILDERFKDLGITMIVYPAGMDTFPVHILTMMSNSPESRIALARALITNPGIILMDEPLSSLNEDLSLAIQDKILQLYQKLKFTLIYVTHNVSEVEKIATRILHLTCGILK